MKNKKILIVEDENIARMFLRTILSKQFEQVFTASNGKEGYELCLEVKPDLILSDLEMPVMNGMTMIKKIREIDTKVPIIVTTAYNDDEHRVENVQGTVLKPINVKEILNLIDSLLTD